MASRADPVLVDYQFERAPAPAVSRAEEWLGVAARLARSAPALILSMPLGTSAGPLSEFHRTSPRPTSRTRVGTNEEVRIREIRFPGGGRLTRSYDASGRLAEVCYPDGQVLRLRDNRITLSNFEGSYYNVRMSRDESCRLRELEYQVGSLPRLSLSYLWNPEGLLREVRYPDGASVLYDWGTAEKLRELTDGFVRINYKYDQSRGLAQIVGSDGASVTEIDLKGKRSQVEWDASSAGRSPLLTPIGICSFDPSGRITRLLRWDGSRIAIAYDPCGRIARIVSASGITFFMRKTSGELVSLVQPNGMRFCWPCGKAAERSLIVGPGAAWLLRRDSRKRLVEVRGISGASVHFEYSRFGTSLWPVVISDSRWGRVVFKYDDSGLPSKIELEGKGTCVISHEKSRRLSNMRLEGCGRDFLETSRLTGWLYLLSLAGPETFQEALGWMYFVMG